MGWFSKIFGGEATAAPIEAVFKGLDALVTSDDERAAAELLKQKALQEPGKLQVELNKIEAQHRSVFVAGWRPFIGWVCGVGLAFVFVINPLIQWVSNKPGPDMPLESLMELIIALLGLGALRTYEKKIGRTK